MASGIIDGSTLYEVIHLFRNRGMADTSAWTWRCSTEVTNALIHGRHLGIAHTPATQLYPGPWGEIQRQLSDQVQLLIPSVYVQRAARRIADDWALSEDGIQLLKSSIDPSYYHSRDRESQRSFACYQENMVVHSWPALVGPHEIFEKRNVRAISHVTGVSQRDLNQAHKASKDSRILRRFASDPSPDNELFMIIWRAYLVDLLIRARYHDEAARMQSGQVLHHPARSPVLKQLPGSRTQYRITNTDRAFANVLLAGALAERSQQKRIALWLENVFKARKAAQYGNLNLNAQEDDKVAERIAVEQAMRLELRTHARTFDEVTDAAIAGGMGLLTSFVLSGWVDVAISAGMYVAAKSKNVGTRVGHLTFERRGRLERFASSGAGRVEREWSHSRNHERVR
jgi:hypothetical protein